MVERVHLCSTHGENLTDDEIDQVYLKNRLAHLSRVRQRNNKAIPPKAENKLETKNSKPSVAAPKQK